MSRHFGLVVLLAALMGGASGCGVTAPGAGDLRPDESRSSFRVLQRCPPGTFVNPSWNPNLVVEANDRSFRLRGEATWRPGCVSRPDIVEENATSFRRIGRSIWERK